MPLGMFCFAQSAIEEVISSIRIMLCYEINVNEQIEFHTLINSVTVCCLIVEGESVKSVEGKLFHNLDILLK